MNKEVNNDQGFLFSKGNYLLLLVSIGVIIAGYILMSGGGSDNPAVFDAEIFNFRRLTLAPLVVIVGYGIGFWAIFKSVNSN